MIDPKLPLIDLHHHLDGGVRVETILDLAHQHNIELPAFDVPGMRPFAQVLEPRPSILSFFEKFHWQTLVMVNEDACRRIAYENVQDAFDEGIDYIELRFSPWFMAETHHLKAEAVTEAVVDGVQSGCRDFNIKVNLIGILSRTYGPETCSKELDALLSQKEHIVGIDLAGDEVHFPGDLYVTHFKRARRAGWHVTIHAGEAAGPESIWQALKELGAERIGHAVSAPQDAVLIDYLREHRIAIESNLTSNVQTSTVKDYASHPLKFFLEQGLIATINTDDPGISAIDLHHEYDCAQKEVGLSETQLHQAQENALTASFLLDEEKRLLKDKCGNRQVLP
jgi:adenosine deaminase